MRGSWEIILLALVSFLLARGCNKNGDWTLTFVFGAIIGGVIWFFLHLIGINIS